MQAKDIEIGKEYAIKIGGGVFPGRARAVITRSEGPGKTSNQVEVLVQELEGNKVRLIQVRDIDCSMEAYLEIEEQKKLRAEQLARKHQELQRLRKQARELLEARGFKMSPPRERYAWSREPKTAQFDEPSIEINDNNLPTLIKLLEGLA